MKSINKTQITIITGGLLLFVVLLFANTKAPVKTKDTEKEEVKLDLSLVKNKNDISDWLKAGNHYYDSTRVVKEMERPTLYRQAVECFKNVLSRDSVNIDARVGLGVCYVEGTAEPMKGITLLKGVVEQDPGNINAQLNLGFFSIKSGQYDKAIERFNKVLQIKPGYIEAYLFLADAYEKTENKAKAIESLEKYVSLSKDDSNKQEIQNYIHQLSL